MSVPPYIPSNKISDQLNFIKSSLGDWAEDQQGIAVIASDVDKMWETAYETATVPRCIICCGGEDIRGDFKVAAATSRVDRHFIVLVSRGSGFTADRGKTISENVGNIRPFTDLLEEARDVIRSLQFDPSVAETMDTEPVDYKGMKPVTIDGYPIHAYTIEFSIGTQLATIFFKSISTIVPLAPVNLSVFSPSALVAQLQWLVVQHDADKYFIYRSLDNITFNKIGTVNGTSTVSFIDNNISSGNTYIYKVSGLNTIGEGNFSNTASIAF